MGHERPLSFAVLSIFRGMVRKYQPESLVCLKNGEFLVPDTNGQDTEQDRLKRRYLDEGTQAVNSPGGFGRWRWTMTRHPGEIRDLLTRFQ